MLIDEYDYRMARRAIPYLMEMENRAAEAAKRRDKKKERELYKVLKSENLEKSENCRKELIETHMFLVFDFLNAFPYKFKSAESVEDLLQAGFLELADAVDKWDIEKGRFQTIVRSQLKKLYREYWRESYIQPQTSMQQDAKLRAYDNMCRLETGSIKDAKTAAAALGRTARTIERARARIEGQSGRVDSLDRIKEQYPGMDFPFEYEREGSRPLDGLGISVDRDFINSARKILKNKTDALLVFDFMVAESNPGQPNIELSKVIEEKTGIKFTYQQLYRCKQTIAAMLVHHGLIDRSYIQDNVRWLDEEVKKLENADLVKKNKYAFLWK